MSDGFFEWVTIGGAVLVILGTIAGASTPDWEVYCWMAGLICWVMIARGRRKHAR